MKKSKRWLLVVTVLLISLTNVACMAPFKKVSIGTTTTSTTSTSTTEVPIVDATTVDEKQIDNGTQTASAKNSKLTGIPQIDYIWDPNLPRELRGYNLSSYPFFAAPPPEEDIHFKCDGLHDGFYASIEHKCQVYHHCVYGIRHDFLCANFTAFDQRTFICHFVSDVDCEGSIKYWNRNDNLYMATTTTTTTTTTIAPPPTARRRPILHPQRPLRRPNKRRPSEDYYYDEEEYEDDYYEERIKRRKQRPRQRKPIIEYDEDEYEDDKPRRPSTNRFRDEEDVEEDYEDRRKYDRPKSRNKPPSSTSDRRKNTGRKPGQSYKTTVDERRSFGDDKPAIPARREKPIEDETESTQGRRLSGRRRINEKRIPSIKQQTSSAIDDLDDYEVPPAGVVPDQEEAATDEETQSKQQQKTTAKPLEEFVTPKANISSVYARPRAPPRIARPVPVTEKRKFQYPIQKTATTTSPSVEEPLDEEDYYEDTARDEHPRRRAPVSNFDDDKLDIEDEVQIPPRKRLQQGRKPTRTTIRKPVTDKKVLLPEDEDDYDNGERYAPRKQSKKRPSRTRGRIEADLDFVDDTDYDDRPLRKSHRHRPKSATRKDFTKSRNTAVDHEDIKDTYEAEPEIPQKTRKSQISGRRKLTSNNRIRLHQSTTTSATQQIDELEDEFAVEDNVDTEELVSPPSSNSPPPTTGGRLATVRVVKRPFLPSRGGSPYLPRGLQPVGIALKPISAHTTDSSHIDMGSTISGVRLLEHGAPILRDSGSNNREQLRTTLPPRSAIPISKNVNSPQAPKISLDELYENDYDVTLNDALNPTLKPLSALSHHYRNYGDGNSNIYSSASGAPIRSDSNHPYNVNNNQSPAYHNINNNNNIYQLQQQQDQSKALQNDPHISQSQSQNLSQIHTNQQHHHPNHQQQQKQFPLNNQYNSDSYFSSTDLRSRTIVPAPPARSSRTEYRGVGARIAQHFYQDFEY